MKTTPRRRPLLKALGEATAILGISLLVVFLFSHVPLTADSYVAYTNLAWEHYPLNKLEWQSKIFHLAPLGGYYLPLRADMYIGSINSLLYYPMFLIWPSPHSVRLLQLIALGIQAVLICRLTNYNRLKCFLILIAFMPYSFSHIVDVSVTGFQLTAAYLLIFLTAAWGRSLGRDESWCWAYPACIGLIMFLGIWAKLQFISFWPVTGIFVLAAAMENRDLLAQARERGRFIRHCVSIAVIAGFPTWILLNSWCGSCGVSKIRYCEWGPKFIKIAMEEGNYEYAPLRHLIGVLKYVTNPLQSAEFIYCTDAKITVSGVALCAVTAALLAYGIVRLRISGMAHRFIAANACAVAVLIAIIACHPGMCAMRHVIMVYPFVLLSIFYIRAQLPRDRTVTVLLSAFVILNLWQYYQLTRMDYRSWERRQRPGYALVPNFDGLQKALDPHSASHVYVHVDWGVYYIKALYGNRDQCNLAMWPLDSIDAVRRVRAICGKIGRRPMFVRMKERSSTDLAFLKRYFPELVPLDLGCDAGPWEVWYQRSKRSRRYTHYR